MGVIVQKYGGTSMANTERVKNVARIAMETQSKGNDVVVVVSAPAGMTDNLIKMAKDARNEGLNEIHSAENNEEKKS
jgi:aspartate kinase